MATDTKPDKMMRIAFAIFSLEASRGHLKWKVTDLVRKTGVSRPLIYRYFGGSKEKLLISALHVFADDFYGFSEVEKDFGRKIREARAQMTETFEAVMFYQKWRTRESFLQKEFVRIEEKFRLKLKSLFPSFDEQQITLAQICIHGLVTAPFLTPAGAEKAFHELRKAGIF